MKTIEGINPNSKPTGTGCAECLATGGWWLHLRRCAECGHIGCCDSSPGQHAEKHAFLMGHPIVASFEPLQNWFFDYRTGKIVKGMKLAAPRWHPENQPAPGPSGRVPQEWESLLHDLV
jgi:Zn-finger in ubiquitin-hydrolases and other protein